MIKLVMFDFDGVLVDSNNAWAEAYLKSARSAGITTAVTYNQIKDHYGKPYMEVLKASFPEAMEDEAVMESIYSNFEEIVASEGFVSSFGRIKGLKASLRRMKKRFRLAVGSGNKRKFLDKFLTRMGLSGYFDLVVSVDDVGRPKPDPDMLIKALDHFRLKPQEAVYVGDSKCDIMAAKNARMHSIAVLSGALTKEEAAKLHPDFVVNDATEVMEALSCIR